MDLTLVERENVLLGTEFLTWLWFITENEQSMFEDKKGQAVGFYLDGKMVVKGGEGLAVSSASVTNPTGSLPEALTGLREGKKVYECMLVFDQDGDEWKMKVKGETMSLTGIKTPKVVVEDDDDLDAAFLEKMFLIERVLEFFDTLFNKFLAVRLDSAAWREEAAKIKVWIS